MTDTSSATNQVLPGVAGGSSRPSSSAVRLDVSAVSHAGHVRKNNEDQFFVTRATSMTGNLGGLAGADATCQRLAGAVGEGGRIWRAYLSVERDPANGNQPTHARDRIGAGPWLNANRMVVANSVAELHARTGDASVFLDERGQRINGQWSGSPSPVQHDILTGSNADGTLAAGLTCADWTSN